MGHELQKSLAPQTRPNPDPLNPRRCFKCQGLGHTPSDCPNKEAISFAEWEAAIEEENEEEENAYLIKDQEENQEEVKLRADEREMPLLERVLSGFQTNENEQNQIIKACSLIISEEEENTLAPFFLSELHENKPQKNHKHLSPFLTCQGPLLQTPLRSKEEWILAIHEV